MKDKSFVAIVVTLLVLIGAAVWQFYSLARSDAWTGGNSVDRSGTLPGDQLRRSTLPTTSPK